MIGCAFPLSKKHSGYHGIYFILLHNYSKRVLKMLVKSFPKQLGLLMILRSLYNCYNHSSHQICKVALDMSHSNWNLTKKKLYSVLYWKMYTLLVTEHWNHIWSFHSVSYLNLQTYYLSDLLFFSVSLIVKCLPNTIIFSLSCSKFKSSSSWYIDILSITSEDVYLPKMTLPFINIIYIIIFRPTFHFAQ